MPVLLVPVAALMLANAMTRRSSDLAKGALVLLIISTFAAGAFLTGEPAGLFALVVLLKWWKR